jgi:mono/diheme cytochrome c family protein
MTGGRAWVKAAGFLAGGLVVLAIIGLVYIMNAGLSARESPGAVETFMAGKVRGLVISRRARNLRNPIERAAEIIAAGREHFADHCATCHANDGSGDTTFGRGLFPRPPDLRLAQTQNLSDGELFYIIEHGIRFTGMPAFGSDDGSTADGSWHLVHFIRHLPELSEAETAEMETLNPASPAETLQRIEEERFLRGEPDERAVPAPPDHRH